MLTFLLFAPLLFVIVRCYTSYSIPQKMDYSTKKIKLQPVFSKISSFKQTFQLYNISMDLKCLRSLSTTVFFEKNFHSLLKIGCHIVKITISFMLAHMSWKFLTKTVHQNNFFQVVVKRLSKPFKWILKYTKNVIKTKSFDVVREIFQIPIIIGEPSVMEYSLYKIIIKILMSAFENTFFKHLSHYI